MYDKPKSTKITINCDMHLVNYAYSAAVKYREHYADSTYRTTITKGVLYAEKIDRDTVIKFVVFGNRAWIKVKQTA